MKKQVQDTYFRTFAGAMKYVREDMERRGLIINEDDWHSQINMGGGYVRARPNVGETHEFHIRLYKGPALKEQRKMLHISVYGMEVRTCTAEGYGECFYELTHYVN